MQPFTARVVYCFCLSALVAACAALPESRPLVAENAPISPSVRARVSPAAELATTMRLHAELAYSYGSNHPSIIEISAAQASLRDSAMPASGRGFEHDLIGALSDELADARRDRAMLAMRYGDRHPELTRADAIVTALMAAINTEVRHTKSLS